MSRWYRHYAGLCRDDKLVSVAIKAKQPVERVVWVWCAILESAAEIDDNGRYELDAAEVAYFLRTDESDILAIETALCASGRVADSTVAKWGNRQFSSDRSRDRVSAYRDRKRRANSADGGETQNCNGDVTLQDCYRNAPETETEADTTTEPKGSVVVARPAPKSTRGTRLASGAEMSERNRADASRIGVPADRVEPLWQRYRDYWTAKPGKEAVKLDWDATWRNWCSSECERRGWAPSSPSQTGSDPPCGIKISPVTDPDAWEAWRLERGGKPLPTDKTGAWSVPSRFPRPTNTEEAA